jgi:hypothetical protein
VRTTDLGVDARKALTAAQVTMIAGWEEDASATVDRQISRQEAARLAGAVKDADRHRLNRHGDRQLNMALDIIVKIHMVRDGTTRLYTQRRTADGRTYREIKRALKRYKPAPSSASCRPSLLDRRHRRVKRFIARQIFRQLQTLIA